MCKLAQKWQNFFCVFLLLPVTSSYAFQMIGDTMNVSPNGWTTVTFANDFDQTPIVVALTDSSVNQPAVIRFRNISTTGFQARVLKEDAGSGNTASGTVAFLAVEPGRHEFPNGDSIEAGSLSTNTFQSGRAGFPYTLEGWDTVTYSAAFTPGSVVVADVQTVNNESPANNTEADPFLATVTRIVNASSFQVALEAGGGVLPTTTTGPWWNPQTQLDLDNETIGWVAMDIGTSGSFIDENSEVILYETFNSGDNVRGVRNGCYNRPSGGFVNTYAATPLVYATMSSRDGGHGGWVRRCAISNSTVGLTIDEVGFDRAHTTEQVSVLVFEKPFVYISSLARANLQKTVAIDNDPFNGVINPKAIPGAEVTYTIRAENIGSSPLTDVVLEDEVPDELDIYVANSGNCGPADFSEGGGVLGESGLDCTAAIVKYDDGSGNFSYTPSPDGNGYDANVSAIRFEFTGSFNTDQITPFIELELKMRVK